MPRSIAEHFEAIESALFEETLAPEDRSRKVINSIVHIMKCGNQDDLTRLFTACARTSKSLYMNVGDVFDEFATYGTKKECRSNNLELHLLNFGVRHFGSIPDPLEVIQKLPPAPDGEPLPISIGRFFCIDELRDIEVVRLLHHLGPSDLNPKEKAAAFGSRIVGGTYDPIIKDKEDAFYSILFLPIFVRSNRPIFTDATQRARWTQNAQDLLGGGQFFPKAPRPAYEALFQSTCDAVDAALHVLDQSTRSQGVGKVLFSTEYFGDCQSDISIKIRLTSYNFDTDDWVYRSTILQPFPSDGARWQHNRQQLTDRCSLPFLSAAPNVQPVELIDEHESDKQYIHIWFGPTAAFDDSELPTGLAPTGDGSFSISEQQWYEYDLTALPLLTEMMIKLLSKELLGADVRPTASTFFGCHSGRWYPSILIDLGSIPREKSQERRARIESLLEAIASTAAYLGARKWVRWEVLPRN